WTVDYSVNTISMHPRFRSQGDDERVRALEAVVAEVGKVAGLGLVAVTLTLVGDCARHEQEDARLACASISAGRSGEVWASAADGSLTSAYPTGTGHGSPSRYDRVVPIVVLAPDVPPGRHDEPVSVLRVAPTLAHLLGVPAPDAATERPLDGR